MVSIVCLQCTKLCIEHLVLVSWFCDCLSLSTRKALQSQLQNLESLKAQLAVIESQLEDWVSDVKEWADSEEMITVKPQ